MENSFSDIQSRVEKLPLPGSIPLDVVQLCADSDTPISQLVHIISVDQNFSTQILRIANSNYFNYSKMIRSIDRAVIILGVDLLKEIALSIAFRPFFLKIRNVPGYDFQTLWDHSLFCAITASALAKKDRKENAGLYYAAGLLHDIGKLVAAEIMPRDFYFLTAKSSRENKKMHILERDSLAFHHGDLGAIIARRWGVPSKLVQMIRYHHYPAEFSGHSDIGNQIQDIYLSNLLTHFMDEELESGIDSMLRLDPNFKTQCSLTKMELDNLIQAVHPIAQKNRLLFEIHQV